MADIRKLVWCTAATAVTMAVGARLNNAAVAGWYQPLPKAPFTPPDAVFPVVWSVVYVLIAASFYLALTAAPGKHGQAGVNGLFISQLLMHILWTFLFSTADISVLPFWSSLPCARFPSIPCGGFTHFRERRPRFLSPASSGCCLPSGSTPVLFISMD